MIADNLRLIVFTSKAWKEEGEGIAYQWNFMVENQYGDQGMKDACTNRNESAPLDDTSKSLVLVNYFRTMPLGFAMPSALSMGEKATTIKMGWNSLDLASHLRFGLMDMVDIDIEPKIFNVFGRLSCRDNSKPLVEMLLACHGASANRWANFVAMRSGGGGAFRAIDMLNGRHVCDREDIHACKETGRMDGRSEEDEKQGSLLPWWIRFKEEKLVFQEPW